MVEAINQGECAECGESDDNYFQAYRTYNDVPADDDEEWGGIERTLKCDCGAVVTVALTPDGVETEGPISHEDASWNEDDE